MVPHPAPPFGLFQMPPMGWAPHVGMPPMVPFGMPVPAAAPPGFVHPFGRQAGFPAAPSFSEAFPPVPPPQAPVRAAEAAGRPPESTGGVVEIPFDGVIKVRSPAS